ncbi:unnamed protein product [Triticum turgidum subsp. durum]|uniref:Uncharacterized protein n=1 Tax=Triticum turgidum subsp. durum TaxID=4567 RepID=A0A9R0Z4K0_TRITD|nr:unnamed protein product [Triticum turgidum subsp. durum]
MATTSLLLAALLLCACAMSVADSSRPDGTVETSIRTAERAVHGGGRRAMVGRMRSLGTRTPKAPPPPQSGTPVDAGEMFAAVHAPLILATIGFRINCGAVCEPNFCKLPYQVLALCYYGNIRPLVSIIKIDRINRVTAIGFNLQTISICRLLHPTWHALVSVPSFLSEKHVNSTVDKDVKRNFMTASKVLIQRICL